VRAPTTIILASLDSKNTSSWVRESWKLKNEHHKNERAGRELAYRVLLEAIVVIRIRGGITLSGRSSVSSS